MTPDDVFGIMMVVMMSAILTLVIFLCNEDRKTYRIAKILDKKLIDVYSIHGFHAVNKTLTVSYLGLNGKKKIRQIIASIEAYENLKIGDAITIKAL